MRGIAWLKRIFEMAATRTTPDTTTTIKLKTLDTTTGTTSLGSATTAETSVLDITTIEETTTIETTTTTETTLTTATKAETLRYRDCSYF